VGFLHLEANNNPYVLHCILVLMMTMSEQSNVVTLRLSKRALQRLEAIRTLEKTDRTTLFKEFIEDGLRKRTIKLYTAGKLSAGRAAEILDISLREFLEILEQECVSISWDSASVKEYLKVKYGE
jgi:predicted HTH domain antitoxin